MQKGEVTHSCVSSKTCMTMVITLLWCNITSYYDRYLWSNIFISVSNVADREKMITIVSICISCIWFLWIDWEDYNETYISMSRSTEVAWSYRYCNQEASSIDSVRPMDGTAITIHNNSSKIIRNEQTSVLERFFNSSRNNNST